ncbi:ML domain-containing protein [Desarmillaria tabescens]|uniref:Phosphatidylglycerol/phosphatidylinositol transfer protein n=1 Tax=Armillaria tabescens TaxID=1929756 RepID=A0AA39NGH6_ARMTA|nr:ML domain-containing protein [Desarmillaria tabescens]KAK0465094.1 ML domain-containing protein [Desarmillaria tabescens]
MFRSTLVSLFLVAAAATSVLANPDTQVSLQGGDEAHTSESWSYVDCGVSTDVIQLESIKIKPDPPKPGEDLTVIVKGYVQERIEEGAYADVTVKLGLIKLLQKSFDLCEEARNANASITCPVEPGPYTVKHTVSLPKEIPPSKFSVDVFGYTAEDDDLVCLQMKIDFMKRPFFKVW